jgi:hypothetical protein
MSETLNWEKELESIRGEELISVKVDMKGSNRVEIPLMQKDGLLENYLATVYANPIGDDEKLKISNNGVLVVEGKRPGVRRDTNIVKLKRDPMRAEFEDDGVRYRAEASVYVDQLSKENGECTFSLYRVPDTQE